MKAADFGGESSPRVVNDRGWVAATRAMVAVVCVIVAVLVVTGVMLSFQYRPNTSAFYGSFMGGVDKPQTARTVHRVAALLLFPTFGLLFIAAVGLVIVRRKPLRLFPPLVAGAMVLATAVSGLVLPWDQISLFRISVGRNYNGYGPILFGHDVKYVLRGADEASPSTVAEWFWLHSAILAGILVVALVVIAWQTRPARTGERTSDT
jgi:quinol-cytochrome oxidoreductase complex cytochrome b subunit